MKTSQVSKSFSLTRNKYVAERITDHGCSGRRSRKVGEEDLDVELTVDLDKLFHLLGRKVMRGQNKASLGDGAVVLTVSRVVRSREFSEGTR